MSRSKWGTGTMTLAGVGERGRKRWRLRVHLGVDPDTGKPRQVERTFYGSEAHARRALAALLEDVRAGKVGPAKARTGVAGRTVGDLFDEWLPLLEARDRSPNTIRGYEARIRLRLRPRLGDLKLAKLNAHVLDRYFHQLADEGLKPSSIRLDAITLSAALSQAVRWDWLPANPLSKVTLPKTNGHDEDDDNLLTFQEVGALYAQAMKDDTPDLAIAVALGAALGLRRGELLGLQWADIDWTRGSIKVARQRTPGRRGEVVRPLKYAKRDSRGKPLHRTEYPGSEVLAVLAAHYDSKRILLGEKPPDEAWILSYDGRTPMTGSMLAKSFDAAAKRVGIRATLHSLRRFAESEIHASGVDLPTAAALLGNSPAVAARHYLRTSPERLALAGAAHGATVAAALVPGESVRTQPQT